MKPSVTPLRYPGGKTWLSSYVKKFLEFHKMTRATVVEPFAGSASISINLLKTNLAEEAYICEKDPLIAAFWNAVFSFNDELVGMIQSIEVSMETWHSFRKYLSDDAANKYSILDMALAFIFYNRTNYSGIIKAGPLGGKQQKSGYKIDCRFNKERIIRKIAELSKFSYRMHVILGDGTQIMKEIADSQKSDRLFFYVDPPYYNSGKILYRNYFGEREHVQLAESLKSLESPWLLSYDDSDFIRGLYEKSEGQPVFTDYQAGYLKRGVKELLFSNKIIPPMTPKAEVVQERYRVEKNRNRQMQMYNKTE